MAEQTEVYQSKYTAEQLEYAISAVPHIGENGMWWVGDIDTGVRANSVDVTGCQVGDCIVVKGIDADGTPTAWEPASKRNMGRGKIVTIIDHTFTEDIDVEEDWGIEDGLFGGRHFWFNDLDGTPLKLRRIWISIYWGTGSKDACTLQPVLRLGHTEPLYGDASWGTGDLASLSFSLGSIGNTITDNYWVTGLLDYDSIDSRTIKVTQEHLSIAPDRCPSVTAVRGIVKYDYANLVKFEMEGTMKAGTTIKVEGEMIE